MHKRSSSIGMIKYHLPTLENYTRSSCMKTERFRLANSKQWQVIASWLWFKFVRSISPWPLMFLFIESWILPKPRKHSSIPVFSSSSTLITKINQAIRKTGCISSHSLPWLRRWYQLSIHFQPHPPHWLRSITIHLELNFKDVAGFSNGPKAKTDPNDNTKALIEPSLIYPFRLKGHLQYGVPIVPPPSPPSFDRWVRWA